MSERKASMGDKVYRGDVVKFIRNNISLGTFMKRTVKTADEACWDLCDKLNYVPAIDEKNEPHWIPVTERLPKENYLDDGYVEPSQPVLVYMSYHTCKISRYWGHRKSKGTSDYVIPDWMDLEEYDGDNVIAWRELPEPYKGGDGMSQSKKIPVTCGECDFSAYSEVQNSLVCTKDDNILCVRQDQRYAYCPLFNVTEPLFNKERARLYLGLELPTNVPTVREVTE